MLLAVLVAVGGSLFFSQGAGQDEAANQAPPVQIDGVLLRVLGDPTQRVSLQAGGTNVQTAVTIQQPLTAQPTTPPDQVQPTALPAQATAVPPTAAPAAQTAVQPVAAAVDSIIFVSYTVQGSDTLYSVSSSRMDTSIALMSRFNISAEDIVAGNVIQLPIGNPAYCPGYRPYAVGEGDTAYSIARRYNTTHDNLKAINKLDANYTIRIADIICVP